MGLRLDSLWSGRLAILLAGWMLLVAVASAVPVYPGSQSGGLGGSAGTIGLTGTSQVRLRFEALNQPAQLANYTFGFFDLSQMTAGVNDPDFALQALQSDKVILLHQAGQALTSRYEVTVNSNARIGVFLLRDATLADYSRGRNAFQPLFSLAGAPGSNLVSQNETELWGGTVFTFDTLGPGAVMAAGAGAFPTDDGLMIGVLGHKISLDQVDQHNSDPVVPEPATLALFGLGLATLTALRRTRARRP